MGKTREHALSKKLRRLGTVEADRAAANLDQTILSLGCWREPERIKGLVAFKQAELIYERAAR